MHKECQPPRDDTSVVQGAVHGSFHQTGRTRLRCVVFALLLSSTASAQLSTRDPVSETPPSPAPEESVPANDGAAEVTGNAEADASAAGKQATASLKDEPETPEQPQLLLQLEQLFAELDTLRQENTRLREQLEAKTTCQQSLVERLQRENALIKEQLEAAKNAQGGSSAEPPSQIGENAAPGTQMQDQSEQVGAQQDVSSLQVEISELQQQIQIINNEHAALLEQLGRTTEAESPATGEQRTHVVQASDSLSKLADRYYGTGSRWPEILAANPLITDPNRLVSGTVLVIP